jgi:hypothetical protein
MSSNAVISTQNLRSSCTKSNSKSFFLRQLSNSSLWLVRCVAEKESPMAQRARLINFSGREGK